MEDHCEKNYKNLLITGGAGFIGSAIVNAYCKDYNIVVVDKLNYCSRKNNWEYPDLVKFYQTDMSNKFYMFKILTDNNIDAIINFAAQTHVDNSFNNVEDFIKDNIYATQALLDVVCAYGKIKKFIHVSTDEVYGESVKQDYYFKEDDIMAPTNPYAATKAATEHIVNSYHKSYKIPIIITRGNNVYGPGQYPEKVVPKFILQALLKKPLTLQNKGESYRTFVYVKDLCDAFKIILHKGEIGQTYNIGSKDDICIKKLGEIIIDLVNSTSVKIYQLGGNKEKFLKIDNEASFLDIADRNFNDNRYNIDSSKINNLGWQPKTDFIEGLCETISWYRKRIEEYEKLI